MPRAEDCQFLDTEYAALCAPFLSSNNNWPKWYLFHTETGSSPSNLFWDVSLFLWDVPSFDAFVPFLLIKGDRSGHQKIGSYAKPPQPCHLETSGAEQGTTKKLCDDAVAELSGEFSGVICLRTLAFYSTQDIHLRSSNWPDNLWTRLCDLLALWVLFGSWLPLNVLHEMLEGT